MSAYSRRGRAGNRRAIERGDRLKLVRFLVGSTTYAFEVARVEEVVQPLALTTLPDLPESVIGVGEHRDRVIPIVDLRLRFGAVSSSVSRSHKWILTRPELQAVPPVPRVGFLVDRVIDVRGTDEPLRSAPSLGGKQASSAVEGVVVFDGALSFVLDLPRLVAELGLTN